MSYNDWITSKFEPSPNALFSLNETAAKNANCKKHLNSMVIRIKELQSKIENLKMDLEADTAYIASSYLNSISFPRFNGYEEFIRFGFWDESKEDNFIPFSTLMASYIHNDLEKDYNIKLAKSRLDDFIWLFFKGADLFNMDYIVDLDGLDQCVDGVNYASSYDYIFNVTVPFTGKVYRVVFRFYDIERLLQHNWIKPFMFGDYRDTEYNSNTNLGQYYGIRACNFGKIEVIVREKENDEVSIELSGNIKKQDYANDNDSKFSNKKLVFNSFDPIDIAAWMNSLFNCNSEELNVFEKNR